LSDKAKVVVAMSGGVDSSVAAALLVEQGYEVSGMMMRLWSEPGAEAYNRCCTPDAMSMARRVAFRLGIPFYAVNAQDFFHKNVVGYFLEGYSSGATPNPCIACNRHVRWQFLLERALAAGADYLATGHYVRLERSEREKTRLLRGVDRSKDQSYVLHVLGQQQLAHALFPLGEFNKSQIREMARRFNLPVAERSESQDLCFLGGTNYRDFLQRHAPEVQTPGPILSREGKHLGEHQGLAFYTIGQRKGLGIASPQPLYVLDKDVERNALVVGPQEELGQIELAAGPVNWISGEIPAEPRRLQVQIRYRAAEAPALVTPGPGGRAHVLFDSSQRDITPGQAAVFYEGEACLGGGIILSTR
jgi:tRNA-uridine 2-sulfurtransferase